MPPVSGRRGGQANADAVPSSINLDEQAFREQSVDAPPSRPHGRASRTGRSARPMVSSTNVDNAVMEVSEHAQNISQKVLLRGSNDRIGPMEGGPPGPGALSAMGSGLPIDPHEPRYCYCNEVSWGEVCSAVLMSLHSLRYESMQMIACDSNDCEREWVSRTSSQ